MSLKELFDLRRAELKRLREGWKWEKGQAQKLLSTNKYAFVARKRINDAEEQIAEIDKRLAGLDNFKKTQKGAKAK